MKSETSKHHEDLHSSRNNEKYDKDSDGRFENNCDHADDDENIEDDEQDNHTPELTLKELIVAIDSVKKENRQTAK